MKEETVQRISNPFQDKLEGLQRTDDSSIAMKEDHKGGTVTKFFSLRQTYAVSNIPAGTHILDSPFPHEFTL